MPGLHSRPRHRRSYERPLAAIGVAAILVVGVDAVSYAATGSPLLLGKFNKAGAPTVVQNTGAGPALSLQTKSTTYAPFATNAKGKVTNLNADKVDGLDAAAIVAKARVNVDAATVNGKSAATIVGDARSATRAFAVVNIDGSLLSSTPGVVVTHVSDGNYCVSAPGFSPTTGVAIASARESSIAQNLFVDGWLAVAETSTVSAACPGAFLVQTYLADQTRVIAIDQKFNVAIF